MAKIINQARCDSIPLPFTNDVCLQIVADMGNSRSNTTTNMFSKTCFVNNKTCYLHFGFLSGKNIFALFLIGRKKFSMSAVCLFPLVAAVSLNKVSHTPVIRAERFVTLKTGAILHSVSLAVHHFTSVSYVSSFGNVKNINWPKTNWLLFVLKRWSWTFAVSHQIIHSNWYWRRCKKPFQKKIVKTS